MNNLNIDKKLLSIFNKHLKNVFHVFKQMYGEESLELRQEVALILSERVPNLISNDPNIFKRRLKDETKKILEDKINNREIYIENFTEPSTKEFYESLDDLEKKMFVLGIPYALAGYQKEDAYQEKDRIDEICQKLNLSKVKCIIKVVGLAHKVKKL